MCDQKIRFFARLFNYSYFRRVYQLNTFTTGNINPPNGKVAKRFDLPLDLFSSEKLNEKPACLEAPKVHSNLLSWKTLENCVDAIIVQVIALLAILSGNSDNANMDRLLQ